MANCKSCGTRIGTSDRNCPNCGRTLNAGSSLSGQKPLDPDATAPPQAKAEARPEPRPEAETAPEARPRPAPPAKAEVKPKPEDAPEVELSEELEEAAAASPFSLRPEELRARISEDPALLEPGLDVYRDPESGEPAGLELSTEVGDIDLLAEDAEGTLVVVKVAGGDAGDVVGPLLEQMGWVSKHIARDERPVRAVVLLEPPVPDLGYAARAVAHSVSFKTWRITIAVDDVKP